MYTTKSIDLLYPHEKCLRVDPHDKSASIIIEICFFTVTNPQIEVVICADVSENRLPETKNNFSGYDISWPTPSVNIAATALSVVTAITALSVPPLSHRCQLSPLSQRCQLSPLSQRCQLSPLSQHCQCHRCHTAASCHRCHTQDNRQRRCAGCVRISSSPGAKKVHLMGS